MHFFFKVTWCEVATKLDTYYDNDVNLGLEKMNVILNDAKLFRLHNQTFRVQVNTGNIKASNFYGK
jgi:hypothetical protein